MTSLRGFAVLCLLLTIIHTHPHTDLTHTQPCPTLPPTRDSSAATPSCASFFCYQLACIDAERAFLHSVQGVVDQAIGSVTGSTAWTEAGDQAKSQGVNELKEYQAQNPPSASAESSSAASKVEAKIGQAVGCEGLVNDASAGSAGANASTADVLSSEKDGRGSAPGGAVDGTSNLGMGVSGGNQKREGQGLSAHAIQFHTADSLLSLCTSSTDWGSRDGCVSASCCLSIESID